jgi:thiol-disulfide isomerase/thioredoxin
MSSPLKLRIRVRVLACLAAALFGACLAGAAELWEFDARSFVQIREAGATRPLVVAFWSTTCPPSAEDMTLFARLHRAYPDIKVVLVAADAPELRPKVERFLAGHDLAGIETWQFGDEAEERLRYSVDRAWRGELPRAYFCASDGTMIVRSGVPDEKWATDWFAHASATLKPSR